jgi:hypothetical protein
VKVLANERELQWGWLRELNGPVGVAQGGEEREAGGYQVSCRSLIEKASGRNERPQANELAIVASRHFEDREAPDAPSPVRFCRRPIQMVILEGAGAQPDDHDNVSNLYADLTQDQRLTHRSRSAAR